MIIGVHNLIYAEHAEQTRAFFRDALGLANIDLHDGWLVFKLPPTELGIHPIDAAGSGRHEMYLMCDDIQATMKELSARGVEFASEISDAGFGLLATINVPGGGTLGLYEPRHKLAIDLPS